MRYADASHVDHRPFLARRPVLGREYSRLGYLGVIGAVTVGDDTVLAAAALLAVLAVLWFIAWLQAVGGLWRGPLVAAILVASLQLARLGPGLPGSGS